jgi:hypothetical protein
MERSMICRIIDWVDNLLSLGGLLIVAMLLAAFFFGIPLLAVWLLFA